MIIMISKRFRTRQNKNDSLTKIGLHPNPSTSTSSFIPRGTDCSLKIECFWGEWLDFVTSRNTLQAVVSTIEHGHYFDSMAADHLVIIKQNHRTLLLFRIKERNHSFLAGYEVCRKQKAATQTNKVTMHLFYSGKPMERKTIDLLGELPRRSTGNK